MGREIRRVPPNWQHPTDYNGDYIRISNCSYKEAITEWVTNHLLWLEGKHPDQLNCSVATEEYKFYAQCYGDAPAYHECLPYEEEEATWYQVYETVSEGTPITPPFETKEELINYLCKCGTYWDHKKGWSRGAAENFVNNGGYMPSMIVFNGNIIDQTQAVL